MISDKPGVNEELSYLYINVMYKLTNQHAGQEVIYCIYSEAVMCVSVSHSLSQQTLSLCFGFSDLPFHLYQVQHTLRTAGTRGHMIGQ